MARRGCWCLSRPSSFATSITRQFALPIGIANANSTIVHSRIQFPREESQRRCAHLCYQSEHFHYTVSWGLRLAGSPWRFILAHNSRTRFDCCFDRSLHKLLILVDNSVGCIKTYWVRWSVTFSTKVFLRWTPCIFVESMNERSPVTISQ